MSGTVQLQSKDQRNMMDELRCGCTKLEVETGRLRGVVREDRISPCARRTLETGE